MAEKNGWRSWMLGVAMTALLAIVLLIGRATFSTINENESEIRMLEKTHSHDMTAIAERLAKSETNISHLKELLEKIDVKLDRIEVKVSN